MAKTDLTKFSRYRYRHFDRDADFVVLRPLRSAGRDLRPGDHFDKTMATLRMHQLLFQQRRIDEVGGCWHKISGLPTPVKAKAIPQTIVLTPPTPAQEQYLRQVEAAAAAPLAADVPAKRKGGRPKGSKNKPKTGDAAD